jgi:site-specific DNA-methyltransferase (adenine-specific)
VIPHWFDAHSVLYHGDCLDVLRELADDMPSAEGIFDAIVTDPPYELGFMGKGWDASGIAYSVDLWKLCLRVLKPGGHLLAFGGTRTSHRLTCAIEDAGFEIRDEIAWLYGSGFPKSLDVSKAIDKAAGAEREVVGLKVSNRPNVVGLAPGGSMGGGAYTERLDTAPATDDAKRWQGWGTALKPAHEPIVVARKPLSGTVAANVQAHGTGALNIDGCRVAPAASRPLRDHEGERTHRETMGGGPMSSSQAVGMTDTGRWPANVVLDEYAAAELDRQSGLLTSGANPTRRGSDKFRDTYGEFAGQEECTSVRGIETGGASRFFKVVRASPSDHVFFPVESTVWCGDESTGDASTSAGRSAESRSDNSPIAGSGSRPTGPFRADAKSIIAITTPSITKSQTSCASPLSGTTTITTGYGSSTAGSTESSSGAVSDARRGNRSSNTTLDGPEHGRATASHASAPTGASGSDDTETSSTPHGGSGEPSVFPADFPTFRYQAKAPTRERPKVNGVAHSTVKPLALMRWLVRLVTPQGGIVLDPFAGSGTTLEACRLEEFRSVGVERESDYLPLIAARLERS